MNQVKLAEKLGISQSGLRAMDAEKLAGYGWQKVGKGKGCYYRKLSGVPGTEEEKESMEEARRRKLIADANYAEIKQEERIRELKRQGATEYMDVLLDALRVLPEAYARMRLTPEQNAIINEAYNNAVERVTNARRMV